MEYNASNDSLTKVLTYGVLVFLFFLLIKTIKMIVFGCQDLNCMMLQSVGIMLFMVIVLSFWGYSPKSYIVDERFLIIHRKISDVKILLQDIVEIRLVRPDEFDGTIKTFGSGGLFGYFGFYYNSKLGGNIELFATQRKNRVLITTSNKKIYLITPDDVNIIEKIKNQ
jgi:hypothetical protein